MLAPRIPPKEYLEWNQFYGAPYGKRIRKYLPEIIKNTSIGTWLQGMFAFQKNNNTRLFEYPFAFFSAELSPGLKVLEIGGGLSGFQFVLSKQGIEVINVDPGLEANGLGWPVDYETIERINRAFRTHVVLKKCFIQDALFLDHSFDRCFSISVIEHLTDKELISVLNHVKRVLKPGGLFVLTVDLFLDLKPFTRRESNEYGRNMSIQELVDLSGMKMIVGKREELFGFPEFDAEKILSDLSKYLLGGGYPALAQLLVLRK